MLNLKIIIIARKTKADVAYDFVTSFWRTNAIALFSAIGKVIDMLVIERCSEQLMTSSSQFAFKSNHSTSMCTNVVK